MKQLRYKWKFDQHWRPVKSQKTLLGAISRMGPADEITIRKDCEHKNTWVDNGIRICKDCQEHLEVTSFRD